jgi:hypothetical protein
LWAIVTQPWATAAAPTPQSDEFITSIDMILGYAIIIFKPNYHFRNEGKDGNQDNAKINCNLTYFASLKHSHNLEFCYRCGEL